MGFSGKKVPFYDIQNFSDNYFIKNRENEKSQNLVFFDFNLMIDNIYHATIYQNFAKSYIFGRIFDICLS